MEEFGLAVVRIWLRMTYRCCGMDAFRHGKDVVLMNAELDATIGPILQVYAEKYGAILSACDGDADRVWRSASIFTRCGRPI